MSATLKTRNSFEIETLGRTLSCWQGETTGALTDDFELTVNGDCFVVPGTLQTGDAVNVWEASDDDPATFAYLFFWADQDVYLQLISASGSVVVKVRAKQGISLPYGLILPGVSTTPLDGASTPAVEAILKAVVANRSGNECRYIFAAVN